MTVPDPELAQWAATADKVLDIQQAPRAPTISPEGGTLEDSVKQVFSREFWLDEYPAGYDPSVFKRLGEENATCVLLPPEPITTTSKLLARVAGREGALWGNGSHCRACGYWGLGFESPITTSGLPCRTVYALVTAGLLSLLLGGLALSGRSRTSTRGVGKGGGYKRAGALEDQAAKEGVKPSMDVPPSEDLERGVPADEPLWFEQLVGENGAAPVVKPVSRMGSDAKPVTRLGKVPTPPIGTGKAPQTSVVAGPSVSRSSTAHAASSMGSALHRGGSRAALPGCGQGGGPSAGLEPLPAELADQGSSMAGRASGATACSMSDALSNACVSGQNDCTSSATTCEIVSLGANMSDAIGVGSKPSQPAGACTQALFAAEARRGSAAASSSAHGASASSSSAAYSSFDHSASCHELNLHVGASSGTAEADAVLAVSATAGTESQSAALVDGLYGGESGFVAAMLAHERPSHVALPAESGMNFGTGCVDSVITEAAGDAREAPSEAERAVEVRGAAKEISCLLKKASWGDAEVVQVMDRVVARVWSSYGAAGVEEVMRQRVESEAKSGRIVGFPLVHTAAGAGRTVAIERLAQLGASVDHTNSSDGGTPLVIASRKGHATTVKTLASLGANLNLQTVDGCTAMYIACQYNKPHAVWALVSAGADSNLSRPEGAFPAYVAAQNGHEECLRILASSGAILTPRTNRAGILWSPRDAAAYQGHYNIVRVIDSHLNPSSLAPAPPFPQVAPRDSASEAMSSSISCHVAAPSTEAASAAADDPEEEKRKAYFEWAISTRNVDEARAVALTSEDYTRIDELKARQATAVGTSRGASEASASEAAAAEEEEEERRKAYFEWAISTRNVGEARAVALMGEDYARIEELEAQLVLPGGDSCCCPGGDKPNSSTNENQSQPTARERRGTRALRRLSLPRASRRGRTDMR